MVQKGRQDMAPLEGSRGRVFGSYRGSTDELSQSLGQTRWKFYLGFRLVKRGGDDEGDQTQR